MLDFRPVTEGGDSAAAAEAVDEPGRTLAERIGQVLVVAVLLALTAGAVLVALRIMPHQVKPPADSNAIDNVFASRVVVGALRIGILFLVGYIVLSVIMGIVHGRFLVGVGPVKTEALFSVKALRAERDELVDDLSAAQELIESLQAEVHARDEALDKLFDLVDTLERDDTR